MHTLARSAPCGAQATWIEQREPAVQQLDTRFVRSAPGSPGVERTTVRSTTSDPAAGGLRQSPAWHEGNNKAIRSTG